MVPIVVPAWLVVGDVWQAGSVIRRIVSVHRNAHVGRWGHGHVRFWWVEWRDSRGRMWMSSEDEFRRWASGGAERVVA